MARYEILSQLPTSGAKKFLALQRGFSAFRKIVVVREILGDLRDDETAFHAFLREAKVAASFSHPNVADLYDLDAEGEQLLIASEFVPGATLAEISRASQRANLRIPLELTLAVLRDTCRGIQYAHGFVDPSGKQNGILHRGLSDEALLVSFEGVTKVTDFCLPHTAEQGRENPFMPPEYAWGDTVDARADVYSLGILLQQAVRTAAKVPQALEAVVQLATARKREQRFGSVNEMWRALEAAAPVAWDPGQLATFMQRLFTDRRAKMADLVSLVEVKETTAVMKLADVFAGGEGEQDVEAAVAEATNPRARNPYQQPEAAEITAPRIVHKQAGPSRIASFFRALLFAILLLASFASGAYVMNPPRVRFIALAVMRGKLWARPPAPPPDSSPASAAAPSEAPDGGAIAEGEGEDEGEVDANSAIAPDGGASIAAASTNEPDHTRTTKTKTKHKRHH